MKRLKSIIDKHPVFVSFLLLMLMLLLLISNTKNMFYISLVIDGFFLILGLLGLITATSKLNRISLKYFIPHGLFMILLDISLIIFSVSMLDPIQKIFFYNNKVTQIEYSELDFTYIKENYKEDTRCNSDRCITKIKRLKYSLFDNYLGYGQNILIMNNGDEIKIPTNLSVMTLNGSSIMFF